MSNTSRPVIRWRARGSGRHMLFRYSDAAPFWPIAYYRRDDDHLVRERQRHSQDLERGWRPRRTPEKGSLLSFAYKRGNVGEHLV